MSEEGGTKIQRRQQPPQQQMQPPQQQMQPPQQQMQQPQQQMQQPQQQMQQPPQQMQQPHLKQNFMPSILKKPIDIVSLKYSIAVIVIFVILNSKIVWTQFSRLPFLNSVDPSIIALIINSILAGVVFYIISMLIKG